MKASSPLIAVFIAGLWVGLVPPAEAGFGGQGVTPVPITEGGLDKDALEIYDRRKANGEAVSYPPYEDVSAAMIAQLKQFPAFQDAAGQPLSNAQITDKVRNMRRAIVCIIDLIGQDDRDTGYALELLLRHRKLCFGLTQRDNNVGMSIFPDGREGFGLEPINIFYKVKDRLDLTSPALFELYVALSHESLHGRQSILKPTGRPDFAETVDLQCREVEAHQLEMDRINEMIRIVEHIRDHESQPADARGATASFGAAILAADDTSGLVTTWLMKLGPMQEQRGNILRFREIYKEAGKAFLNNTADKDAIREQLRPFQSWVQTFARSRDFSEINTAIFSTAPVITGPPGSRTVQPAEGGGMKQYLVPDMQLVDIETGTDIVSGATFNLEQTHLYFIGVNLGEPNTGILARFEINQSNGAVMQETLEVCLSSPMLGDGGQLLCNPFETTDPFYALGGAGADLCRFIDTDADGCPDSVTHAGNLPQSATFSVGHAEFIDRDTICGYPEIAGTVADSLQPFCVATRDTPGGMFSGGPPARRGDDVVITPGPAGLAFEGRTSLPCTGTPGRNFEIFSMPEKGPPVSIGSGTFGWRGFACPDLGTPLDASHSLQIIDSQGLTSIDFPCQPAPGDIPLLQQSPPFSDGPWGHGEFTVTVQSWPGQPIASSQSTDLGNWSPGPTTHCNCYGTGTIAVNGPGALGAPAQDFIRLNHGPVPPPPGGTPQEFRIFPGVPTHLDVSVPGENGCLEYVLETPPDLNDLLFAWNKDGTLTATLLTFGGPVEFTFRKQWVMGGTPAGPPITVRLVPDDVQLVNPQTYTGPDGQDYVNVVVLNLNGVHCPLYQFALSNNPTDSCIEPHWHNSFHYGEFVYSLQVPTLGIADPDPPGCGFGTFPPVIPEVVRIPHSEWLQFQGIQRP